MRPGNGISGTEYPWILVPQLRGLPGRTGTESTERSVLCGMLFTVPYCAGCFLLCHTVQDAFYCAILPIISYLEKRPTLRKISAIFVPRKREELSSPGKIPISVILPRERADT